MEYVRLGRTELSVSKVGLGTWQFGAGYWGWGKELDEERAIKIIRTAKDLGINLIDTAEIYGWGKSERIVGEAVKEFREEVIIATKVWPTNFTYNGVKKSLKKSLERLGTDYVDLYQVHWPRRFVSMKGGFRAMEELLEEGKIRAIGVSNFSVKQMIQAKGYLKRHEIASNQVEYNLFKRKFVEEELLPYSKEEGITIIAYSPLAQGLLSGKYTSKRLPGNWQRRLLVRFYFYRRWMGVLDEVVNALKEIAERRGVHPAQVALNWVIRHENVVAIPGAKKEEHVRLNAGAVGWKLDKEELEKLDSLTKLP